MRLLLLACLALLPLRLSAADLIEVRCATFFGSDQAAPKVLDLITGEQLGMVLIPPTPVPPNGVLNGEQTKEVSFATTFDEMGAPKTFITRKVGPTIALTVKPDGVNFKVTATFKETFKTGERISLTKTGSPYVMPLLAYAGFEAADIVCTPGKWTLYTTQDTTATTSESKWMAIAIRINPPST
jgi:hypothetical protein